MPRVIACGELSRDPLTLLPRGCLEEGFDLLTRSGVTPRPHDERQPGDPLALAFQGTLAPDQQTAADELVRYDTGMLGATTAFGKTVVAANLIARRGVNTLVRGHRRHLLERWVARLQDFLDVPAESIGVIRGAMRRPTGRMDVALIQSLNRQGTVDDLVDRYGRVIVDECHHVSAVRLARRRVRCPSAAGRPG